MLIPGSQLLEAPVLSLQTGSELGRIHRAVINPDNLFIVAFELTGKQLDYSPAFLVTEDIRELGDMGMIIDSVDEIVELHDVISLKKTYERSFEIIGIKVVDEDGNKLGKVGDTVINPSTFVIQQLSVKRPLLKSLDDTEILVHRSQIVNVTNKQITVRRAAVKHHQSLRSRYNYVNPFRKTTSARPETSSADQSQN